MIEVPDGLTRFKIGEKEFALDMVEASKEFNRIIRECADQNLNNFEHLDRFADWVETKVAVRLIPAQSLWLVRKLNEEFDEKKGPTADGLTPPC